MRRKTVHKVGLWLFAVQIPPAWALGWLEEVRYVSLLSIYAIVVAHWSALEATKPPEKE